MKFNIGDFVKIIEVDQVKYGRITDISFDDWYEIDSDAGTYFYKALIVPISEYEMMNSVPGEYISAVNDFEMDQILVG